MNNAKTILERDVQLRDADMVTYKVRFDVSEVDEEHVNMRTLETFHENLQVYIRVIDSGFSDIKPRTHAQERLILLDKQLHSIAMSPGTVKQNEYLASAQYTNEYQSFIDAFSKYSSQFNEKLCELLIDVLMEHFKIDTVAAMRMKDIADEYMDGNPFNYICGSTYKKKKDTSDLYVKYFFLAKNDLYIDRAYIYGHKWLFDKVPEDIVEKINGICNDIEKDEEELTEKLVAVFDMGDDDFEATEEIVQKVMELRDCDKDEAERFIALGMELECTFGDLNATFEEESSSEHIYVANGHRYHVGTDSELESVASDRVHNDPEYEYFWREAVAAKSTTDGLEKWLDNIISIDGWVSILNHYDGCSHSHEVDGHCFEVCIAD